MNMKVSPKPTLFIATISNAIFVCVLALTLAFGVSNARADETCSSPYLARIEGQEEFVYVWTLGMEGLGDGSDKLVTVDVKPGSPNYGKVISATSVGGRNEAHHGGFTDDRRQLWLAGLENSRVFIFDVHTDPAKPQHAKTIDNFVEATGGAIGPHGAYAVAVVRSVQPRAARREAGRLRRARRAGALPRLVRSVPGRGATRPRGRGR